MFAPQTMAMQRRQTVEASCGLSIEEAKSDLHADQLEMQSLMQ